MAIRRLKQPEPVAGLEIMDITEDGRGIGKSEGRVIFVDKAVPGDVADVTLFRRRKTLFEGRIERIVSPSSHRSVPFCLSFGICGGCKWQHLDYPAQLIYKQKQVADALERLAGMKGVTVSPILPSPETRYYRNKLEFTFSNRRWLEAGEMRRQPAGEAGAAGEPGADNETGAGDEAGADNALGFHVPGRFDKIVDIGHCYLQQDPSNRIRNAVREYALREGLEFYDLKAHKGLLRNLVIRTSSTGEVMVILVFASEDAEAIGGLMTFLEKEFPELTSLQYVVNRKLNDTIADQEVRCWSGRDHIFEEMETPGGPVRFRIGPKSFYQTNSKQAFRLYQVAADFAGFRGDELVYDLYTGAGTIANFIAGRVRKVVGIEYVEPAVRDARENSALNGIANTRFFAGDMKVVLNEEFVAREGRPDVIITDPPRAGMHADVVDRILSIAPSRIVYISCNPATQARDLLPLREHYRISKVQPVDMFPHTTHVENVILLERN